MPDSPKRENSSNAQPVPIPQAASKRKRMSIIIAVIVVALLLGGIVFGIIFLLRDSADEPSGTPQSTLPPGADSQRQTPPPSEQASITPFPTAIPSQPKASPDQSPAPTRSRAPATVPPNLPFATPTTTPDVSDGSNVGVAVRYQRSPSFTLSITSARQTSDPTTVDHYRPVGDAPYSLLQLLDREGKIIAEEQFSLGTSVIAEGETVGGNVSLAESTAYIVVSVPEDATPSLARVLTPSLTILDQQHFTFTPPSDSSTTSLVPRILSAIRAAWEGIVPNREARAQASRSGDFIIAIINEPGAENQLVPVANNVLEMLETVEPWISFAGNVRVEIIENTTTELNCTTIEAASNVYPACPNDESVISAVNSSGVPWDTIIVVHPYSCNCGTVGTHFPPITAVGSTVGLHVVTHELGHSVGHMVDEYSYKHGNTDDSVEGPNCFESKTECLNATGHFEGAVQCSLGCSTVSQWRPANRIMFNSYTPFEFGPLEECVMGSRLAEFIGGGDYECDVGRYWGWHR